MVEEEWKDGRRVRRGRGGRKGRGGGRRGRVERRVDFDYHVSLVAKTISKFLYWLNK